MQSINNLQDVIKVNNINSKNKYTTYNRFQFGSKIIEVGSEYNFTNYINNTNLKDFIIDYKQIEFIIEILKINKDITIDNFEVVGNSLIIKFNNTKYELKITPEKLDENYENSVLLKTENDFSKMEFLGKIGWVQFHKLLKIAKTQKIQNDVTDLPYRNFFINNGKYLLTNKIQIISNIISNLKDCILNIEKLTEHNDCEYLNVYADADFYYYESNLITNKIDKNEFQKVYNQTVEVYNDALKNADNLFYANLQNFKLKKVKNIRLNFAESKMIYNDNFENTFNDKFDIICNNLATGKKDLPIIEFSYANFVNIYNLLDVKDSVLIKIPNEINKPFFIEDNLIMPIRVADDNYIEYNKKEFETPFEPVTKEIEVTPEVKTTKTKKPKTMNLKKEIKTIPIKSKYYEPVTEEIKEEIKENLEVKNEVMEIAPKIDLKVEKIEIEPVTQIKKRSVPKELKPVKKEVKNELSETVITPNFDIIDFLYITCFNELENLVFFNTDYKNNRLYLDNCELSFNQIKDKIEVIELDVNCKLHFYKIKDKKELLNLVRSKIKAAA